MHSTLLHGMMIAAVAAVAAPTVPVGAQSINIDLGTLSGGPDASYAAAGSAGVWNVVQPSDDRSIGQLVSDGPNGPSIETCLRDVDGNLCVASAIVPVVNTNHADNQETNGDAQSLVDDYLPGVVGSELPLTFRDLQSGVYEVTTYAWHPALPDWVSTVSVGNNSPAAGAEVGGAWPGALQEGVTHTVHTTNVLDGELRIGVASLDPDLVPVLNGVQIRLLSQLIGDTNGDGAVNVDDLIVVILGWTTPGHGCDGIQQICPGDLNGDGAVNVDDLVLVLLHWTG